ncbi:hypothetical protein PENTCL1PPCAC_17444, partial [Pristionchus entomophagus]
MKWSLGSHLTPLLTLILLKPVIYPLRSVVVYADRAEVKRVVTTRLPKGTNEIILQNVSNVIERQSVRVDAQGVLIQEVQYQEIPLDTITETEKVR